ncbi:DnaJ domain-containing protein [Paraphysoderma sedebokerense]|nr:DnaJ domain-containing protein [Paraphysoderma sedebokerense]
MNEYFNNPQNAQKDFSSSFPSSSSALTESDYENLYGILNCDPSNTVVQISTEYKRLALLHHPDKAPQSSSTSDNQHLAKFLKIQKAYEILSNHESKKEYDLWFHSGLDVAFEKWKLLGGQSTHWSNKPKFRTVGFGQDDRSSERTGSKGLVPEGRRSDEGSQTQDTDDLYRKFRNYEL